MPLFHPRLVNRRIHAMAPMLAERYQQHCGTIAVFVQHLRSGALGDAKEVSLHGGFLERIFGDVLGYTTMARAREGRWELHAEQRVGRGRADAALGFFQQGQTHIVAPIELKKASEFLDHTRGRAQSAVQQAWDYANHAPESRWIIVSNYRETRLYTKLRGPGEFEVFKLEELDQQPAFSRFVALLGRDALVGAGPGQAAPLDELLAESEANQRAVTAQFYRDYRDLRVRLFDELRRRHSNIPVAELLAYAQTILDRVLFLAFAEDRGLIPRQTIGNAYRFRDPYTRAPIWRNFVALFRAVDQGSASLGIPAYNGGLFRPVAELESLEVSDELCGSFDRIADYDFGEDVSVEVLGHVFEQSLTDLEELRAEAEAAAGVSPPPPPPTQRRPSQRNAEGIFYTPAHVTSFLLRRTVGVAIGEAWQRANAGRGLGKKDRIAALESYQDELRRMRVLDPSCGSGAFLIAAFDLLSQEFERANRILAELRDQQASLFDLSKAVLNENLFGIDKSGESVEITKLSLWLKTAKSGKALTFIDRNIRRGNSVVSDPTVDPWAFDWSAGRVARSFLEATSPENTEEIAAIDARWREGFDVVIGNPPYVRHELLGPYKEHFQQAFRVYDGSADLFVYFFERGLQLLKPGGRLGFIVSNKWLRSGYADKLRAHFASACTIETLVDFGHAPIFPDADAFPCIIILRKAPPADDHTVQVTEFPREELGKELIASYVDSHRYAQPQRELGSAAWTLMPPALRALFEGLRQRGTPLGEFLQSKPFYGIKTGCNEAFLVDDATKERLCREDPRSVELMKRYLRGQDLSRWSPRETRQWMIFARRGVQIDRYPALKAHLLGFYDQLLPRLADRDARGWPGRKPGSYAWYELQDSVDYFELFERPKLVYPDILWRADFCVAPAGTYINNTSYLLPTDDPWVLACLNSPVLWSYHWRTAQHAKDEALRMFGEYMITLPIAPATDEQRQRVADDVPRIIRLTRETHDCLDGLGEVLRLQHQVERPAAVVKRFAAGTWSDDMLKDVVKQRPRDAPPLSAAALRALRTLFQEEGARLAGLRAESAALERSIAATVHAAYGLAPDDLALLRATAPPRSPVGL